MSSSRDVVGEVEREALHLHDRVDERVDVGRLRAAHALEQLEALRARAASGRASSRSNGGTRNVTSPSTSTKMPPSPTMTTGPNSASCETPTSVSTPPRHHLADEHAFDRGRCGRPSCALASSSSYAARTSFGRADADAHQAERRSCAAGRATTPSSRPGSRSRCAAFAASAADSHSTSFDGLDAVRREHLLRLLLGQRVARLGARRACARAFFAAGERRRSARRRTASGSAPRTSSSRRTPGPRCDAVPERAEHRQPAVEQALVVRVVGAGGRAPDHEDRLVGGLRDVDRGRA